MWAEPIHTEMKASNSNLTKTEEKHFYLKALSLIPSKYFVAYYKSYAEAKYFQNKTPGSRKITNIQGAKAETFKLN